MVVRLELTGNSAAGTPPSTTVAYAANLRSVLPQAARGWLAQGPARGVLERILPAVVAGGVLVGVVGGCVCGVYRALSVPSDIMRAAAPGSSLRTDRTASFTRGGVVALFAAAVCAPVVALPGDRGGLASVDWARRRWRSAPGDASPWLVSGSRSRGACPGG